MAYKLVVANRVKVPIKLKLDNAGESASFSFSLLCRRLDTDEIKDLSQSGEVLMSEFMKGVVEGWENQKLVVDEDGNPADFNDDSLEVLLKTPGVAALSYAKYLEYCSAKAKN
ncbi:MAG TPA: hypothetical protein VGE12_18650 [Noviherbaspirillum sp.]